MDKNKQSALLEQYDNAVSLAMRALILAELEIKDKEAFEKAAATGKNSELFLFAADHIPNFNKKFERIIEKVTEIFAKELEREEDTHS